VEKTKVRAKVKAKRSMRTDVAAAYRLPCSDAAVSGATGNGWDAWFKILDAAKATRLTHTEMVTRLGAMHPRVGLWWLQNIVVGYERARHLRKVHQTTAGYKVGGSKTVPVAVKLLYAAWADPALRRKWMGAAKLQITRSIPAKSMRIRWSDGSRLEVLFHAKGAARSQVSVDQTGLPSAAAAAEVKSYWKERLTRLEAVLQS
jgi:hypothetical protein